MRAVREGGKFTFPSMELGAISESDAKQVKEAWPELERQLTGDEEGRGAFAFLCLRNAQIEAVTPAGPKRCPILLVATRAVEAFTPGI